MKIYVIAFTGIGIGSAFSVLTGHGQEMFGAVFMVFIGIAVARNDAGLSMLTGEPKP